MKCKNEYDFLKKYNNFSSYKILDKVMLNLGFNKYDMKYISSPGSSSSKVYLIQNELQELFAVKIVLKGKSRVSLKTEEINNKMLRKNINIPIPKIIYNDIIDGFEVMVSKCIGTENFYESYIKCKHPLSFYYNKWEIVINEIIDMWNRTKFYNYEIEKSPRNNLQRTNRIINGLENLKVDGVNFENYKYYNTIINGVECGSIKSAIDECSAISLPKYGIFCHGDPQPTNIIISNETWTLVDWEWCGYNHDWRMMFAHLYGWWATRVIMPAFCEKVVIEKNKIIINYKINPDRRIKKFQKILLKSLTKKHEIKKEDVKDINKFLILIYLGDIRFLNIWGREWFLGVLIGESLMITESIKSNKCIKPNNLFVLNESDFL